MSPTNPALTSLLLITTLGAPHLGVPGQLAGWGEHLGVPGQLAGWGEHLASEMWVFAQSPQTPPAPTLKVYSRETVVDVTVADATGNPVHGLTQSDFTVKEDNKPQPIRSFEEFGAGTVQPPPKLPPNVYTNLQPPAASGATNILWLDFTNAAPVLAQQCCSGSGFVPTGPCTPPPAKSAPSKSPSPSPRSDL
jgi:hypothetical protein